MRENNKTNTIYVLSVGMDERKDAILRAAFRMHTREQYALANSAVGVEPTLAVVDIDGPQGSGVWSEFRASNPTLPAIVVSISEPVSGIDAPFLSKPIRVETLFPALRDLLSGKAQASTVNKYRQEAMAAAGVAESKQKAEVGSPAQKIEPPIVNEVVPTPSLLTAKPVEANVAVEQASSRAFLTTFNPNMGLLGKVRAAVKMQENVVILHQDQPVMLVLPKDNMALLLESLDKLRTLCTMSSGEFKSKLIPADKGLPAAVNIKLMNLMWQLSIWTAQGRLAHPLTPDTRLVLRCWPNFTRVALIPDAMRVAAFLTRTPVNLHILFKVLRIDVKHLANFLAAAYVTGFLQVEGDQDAWNGENGAIEERGVEVGTKHVGSDVEAPFERDNKPRSSVLSRLLKKLSS